MDSGQKIDLQLISEALRGNTSAFDELFARYESQIRSMLAQRCLSRDDAKDILQETFIRAYLNLEKFQPQYAFGQWIHTIARNLFIDYTRRRKGDYIEIESGHYETPCLAPNPEECVISKQNSRKLEQVLTTMPENYRIIIELRFFRELSYEEISEKLNMPMGTVKTQIHRARERFLKELNIGAAQDDYFMNK